MKREFIIFLFSLFLTLSVGSFEQVLACSCSEQKPVCEAFGSAKAVFIGEVIEGESPERMSDLLKIGGDSKPFILKVKESFLGVKVNKEIAIYTGSGFGDCGFPFQKGETYLVYAYERNGNLQTNICTRSAHITRVDDEDFEFLRSLQKNPSGARLFGTVELYAKSSLEDNYIQPMKGLRLLVEQLNGRRQKFQVFTDKLGKYELIGLPTGKYKITPFLPKHLESNQLDDGFVEFELNDKGCYKQDFSVENESLVFVKVVDSEGNPVQNIWVEFIPVNIDSKPKNIFGIREFSVTNPQGGLYEFNLPPGQYTISVNYFHAPDKNHPFATTFYPSTNDRSKAEVIEVKRGTQIENLIIKLPPRLTEKEITGTVYWADGTPVSAAEVYILDDIDLRFCINGCDFKTDLQGDFSIRGYEGRTYRVKAKAEKNINGETQMFEAESEPFSLNGTIPMIKLSLTQKKEE